MWLALDEHCDDDHPTCHGTAPERVHANQTDPRLDHGGDQDSDQGDARGQPSDPSNRLAPAPRRRRRSTVTRARAGDGLDVLRKDAVSSATPPGSAGPRPCTRRASPGPSASSRIVARPRLAASSGEQRAPEDRPREHDVEEQDGGDDEEDSARRRREPGARGRGRRTNRTACDDADGYDDSQARGRRRTPPRSRRRACSLARLHQKAVDEITGGADAEADDHVVAHTRK